MGVKWNPMGLIAYCTQLLIAPPSSTVTIATIFGGVVYEVIEKLEISNIKDSPYNLYVKTFEKVVRKSLNESFGIADNEEKIISDLAEINLSNCQVIHSDCKSYLNETIFNILNGYGVFTDNISNKTIDKFIDSINIEMQQKTLDDSVLQSFVTYELTNKIHEIELDTNRIAKDTNTDVKEMMADIKDVKTSIEGLKATSIESSTSSADSKFLEAVHKNKKYYIDKWNERLFLHRGESNRPLTLSNTFIHHDYSVINQSSGKAISENNSDIEQYLEDFIDNKTCDSLLVTGLPGMGKSSLVAYLANKYANDDSVIILRFKDFAKKELADNTHMPDYSGLHLAISTRLGIDIDDFETYLEGKILILDGFDELKNYGVNQSVLKEFIDILDYNKNIGLIITSRENYVDLKNVKFNSYLSLEPFSETKIREYYRIIKDEKLPDNIQINNEKVLGIPVILYMAIEVGIDISSNESRCELYERIFDIDEGIFERFKSWEAGGHPVKYDKNALHQLLQKLAFYMFEHKEDSDDKEISVTETIYIDLAKSIKNDKGEPAFSTDTRTILDFPIKNLYEGSKNIEFVHNSIYEYFTAEYMYQKIKNGLEDNDKENFAGVLGKLFKKNILSKEIIEYLYYKMSIDISNVSNQFFVDTFDLMLEKGMTYYTKERYENVIKCEGRVFVNMLELLHAWKYDRDNRLTIKYNRMEKEYIVCTRNLSARLNLIGTYLIGANMRGADLRGADLRGADLRGANLYGADLNFANLSRADLRRTDLSRTNLSRTDLSRANLSEVNLTGVNLLGVYLFEAVFDVNNIKIVVEKLPEALNEVLVFIESLEKAISYQEYKELSLKGLC